MVRRSAAIAVVRRTADRLRVASRARARVIALTGLVLGAVGSCGLPQIKPPGLP